ncbi:caspase domain-containing protein [Maribacter chungangensis]|uniref:Caspase domain-containing protein n=1 Tax=Maribacter chungangensis TaxID=1069117 RepID=A0ABW3B3L4_9FLAO
MKSILKNYIRVFLFLAAYLLHAQKPNIEISFKDYHSSNITNLSISKNQSNYFTSDDSGKILMNDADDFDYIKTVRESSGIPIKYMRLIRNDSILLFTQKYHFSGGTTDSLLGIRLYDNEVIVKNKFSGSFIDKQTDYLILSSNNNYLDMLEVFDNNMSQITKIYPNSSVNIAAVSSNATYLAYVEGDLMNQTKLVQKNIEANEDVINTAIPSNLYLLHLFFDKQSNELFALAVDEENDKLKIFNISSYGSFLNPSYAIDFDLDRFVKIFPSVSNNNYQVTLTTVHNSMSIGPTVITKKGDSFESFVPPLKSGAVFSSYFTDKNQFLFFERYNQNFNSVLKSCVYDVLKKEVVQSFPKTSQKYYSGSFLKNDSWMVVGKEVKSDVQTPFEYQLKYYEPGTFKNRFGLLDYKDYLEVNHQAVDYAKSEFLFDKNTGIHPFSGYKKISSTRNEYGFYKYDLINDKVEAISLLETNYNSILDYNNETNNLLLSIQRYTNNGFVEPQEFQVLDNKISKVLKGKYKFGKFSNDGKYLLTVDATNLLEVRLIENNTILFKEKLVDGNYELFSIAENAFVITNSFMEIDINKCNKETIFLGFFEEHTYSSQKRECVLFSDLDLLGEGLAAIVQGLGVIFGEKSLNFSQSEFPMSISLNNDETKAMISLSNGKISIYDTSSLLELGSMIHPNKKSHVFIDYKGNYFSNINSEEYLTAIKGNKKLLLSDLEKDFFKPQNILEIFGQPNEEYLSVLNKALNIRGEYKYKNVDSINLSTNITSPIKNKRSTKNENELPNLYVLTIGVSDYIESDYNLTFADKDAIDIAKIYGTLDRTSIDSYNRKFYGNTYELNDFNSETKLSLKRYQDSYEYSGKLEPVSSDGTVWLENRSGNYFLWDFKIETISSIILPKEFKPSVWSDDKVTFINPDNSGFYIKTVNNEFYNYNFVTKSFNKSDLPFEIGSNDWVQPITRNKWVKFDSEKNFWSQRLTINVSSKGPKDIFKDISFNLRPYTSINQDGEIVKENVADFEMDLNARPRAISTDGNHFIYSAALGMEDALFYKNLEDKNSLPIKIKDSVDYGSDIFLSDDGLAYTIVKPSDDSNSSIAETYSLNGELLTTINLQSDSFTFFNNHYKWIGSKSGLLEKNPLNKADDRLLQNNKAYSFKNSFVNYLTNKEATSDNIKVELVDFFKTAKPNDQVIVFLAGHGVLDTDLNYYFAPHDMNFTNVQEKGVALNLILEHLKQSKSNNKLLLMDSCHSGNVLDIDSSDNVSLGSGLASDTRGSKSRSTKKVAFKISEAVSDLFEDFMSKSGVTIISASSGGDVAYENKDLGNGAFTSAYIDILKNELKGNNSFLYNKEDLDKTINLTNDNIESMLKNVMMKTNGKQVPDLREINKSSNLKMW